MKLKTVLAAFAAMVTMGVNAQSWTAPTITGEDPVAGTQYKVMNVGAGTFLDMGKAWFSWNTTAILSNTGVNFTMTADGDNWKFIRTGTQGVFTSGNGIAGDAMHVDNTAQTYGITKLSNGYYHIHDAGGDASSLCWGNDGTTVGVVAHADATADGWNCEWVFILPANVETAANIYSARLALYNEYLKAYAIGANTDDAAVVYNNASATVAQLNEATTALIQTRRDYMISIATESNPQDLTEFFVVNADFSTGDGTGWTLTGSAGNQQWGTGAMESWNNNNVSVTQDLTGLPNGRFRVSCDMISGNTGRTAYVYAKGMSEVNGENVNAQSSAGNYTTMSNEVAGNTISAYPVLVDNHIMTIGFKDPSGWVVVDNFKVLYYGPDLTAIKEALQANIDAVADLEGTTTTAAYNAAKTYADGINMDELTTEEAISAASAELNTRVDAAKALQSSYANYKTITTAISNISNSIDLSAASTTVEAATTVEDIEAGVETARTALKTYLAGVENDEIDLTVALLINPSFELGLDGWTNNGMQTQNNNSFGGKVGSIYAEAWQPNGTKSVSQTLSSMPAGYYTLSANILARGVTSAKLYVGSAEVAATIVDASNPYSVILNNTASANLTIGFEAVGTGAGSSWVATDNFVLKYLGTAPLLIFQNELAAAAAAARTHAASLAIPTAALTIYNNAINEAEANNATIEACQNSVAAIEAATATADALVAPYAAYQATVTNANFAGVAAATINEQSDVVSAATEASTINEATATLQVAIDALAFDVTSFTITNPSPIANNAMANGWEGDNFGDSSNGVSEYWNKSGADFHQTVNLPAGKYRMTVVALQRTNMTGTVYAGETSTIIVQVPTSTANSRAQAASWFAAGNGKNYVNFTLTDAADVTIGLKADETTNDHWTVWQSFKLETFDESVAASYLAPGFADAVAAAQAIYDNAAYVNVTGSEKTNLGNAIAATPSTVAEYEAALDALTTASDAFTAAKTNYDIYATERSLANAISTEIVVDAPTTAAEALAAFKTLKVAEYNYVATEYPYSATSKIGEFSTWTRTGTVNGSTKNEFEALTSQHWSGTAMTYYEQPADGWNQNAWTANYTKTTTLPAGNYIIKVAARAASGNGTTAKITCSASSIEGPIFNFGDTGKGITTDGVASFEEGTFANGGNGRGWVWNYLPFTLTAETEVTMTVVAEGNGTHQWFSVCDGELLSKTNIATAVAYNETSDNTIEDVDVANVTMSRAIKVGYNTVVLPFDLTASQVQAAFGTGTEVYAFSEESADPNNVIINFNKDITGTITANIPVLVKATSASSAQEFDGVQIVAPTTGAIVMGTNVNFIGVFGPTTVDEGNYFIGNGALYKSAGSTSIKAFRAYIYAQDAIAPVKMFIGGIATGINEINGAIATEDNAPVFNLAGQRVNKAQKGIYIQNGKKVLVK